MAIAPPEAGSAGDLIPFHFDGAPVRAVIIAGEPYFVGKDVADRLGYADTNNAIKQHCKGVAKHHPLQTAGGVQNVRILAEPDVLRLIVGSKLPAAERFEAWVFEEVLPSIRKTGSYTAPGVGLTPVHPGITAKQEAQLRQARLIWGVHAARRLWLEMGLADISKLQPETRQVSMFDAPRTAIADIPALAPHSRRTLTAEVLNAIARRIEGGATKRAACEAEGVTYDALKMAVYRARLRAQQQH